MNKCYTLQFQVIIPGSWVFALILNMPDFLVTDIEKIKNENICVNIWPKDWMAKAKSVTWLVMVVVSLALMIVLYSRVVYNLWLKRNDDNELANQQKVSVAQNSPINGWRFSSVLQKLFVCMKNISKQLDYKFTFRQNYSFVAFLKQNYFEDITVFSVHPPCSSPSLEQW